MQRARGARRALRAAPSLVAAGAACGAALGSHPAGWPPTNAGAPTAGSAGAAVPPPRWAPARRAARRSRRSPGESRAAACRPARRALPEAAAAAAAAGQHLHLGQRLALILRSTIALPDWAILVTLSALPLVELRGGVPVGLWLGLSVPQVMFLCIVGNMLPIPLILGILRLPAATRLLQPLLTRASRKTEAIGAHDRWVGVAAFVGVPLPGTGAWTGAMVAHLLGMDLREAVTSVGAGVCVAACIMASLTLAGWFGCGIAVSLCIVAFASRYLPLQRLRTASKVSS